MEYQFKGKHYICSFKELEYKSNRFIIEVIKHALTSCNINILSFQEYYFENNAMTCSWLLSESHCSIHTYPEHNAMFIDCFTCGDNFDVNKFHDILIKFLNPLNKQYRIINRN